MDVDERVNETISDEVLRTRVRSSIEAVKERAGCLSIFRHPYFLLLNTFLLTGVMGTFFSSSLAQYHVERDREAIRYQQHITSTTAAILEFSELLYLRLTHNNMMVEALRRQTGTEEIIRRKAAYDEVFIKWNARIPINMFILRETGNAGDSSRMENFVLYNLVPMLARIDKCITRGYDSALEHTFDRAKFENCNYDNIGLSAPLMERLKVNYRSSGALSQLLIVSQACASALIDGSYRLMSLDQTPALLASVYARAEQSCGTERKAVDGFQESSSE